MVNIRRSKVNIHRSKVNIRRSMVTTRPATCNELFYTSFWLQWNLLVPLELDPPHITALYCHLLHRWLDKNNQPNQIDCNLSCPNHAPGAGRTECCSGSTERVLSLLPCDLSLSVFRCSEWLPPLLTSRTVNCRSLNCLMPAFVLWIMQVQANNHTTDGSPLGHGKMVLSMWSGSQSRLQQPLTKQDACFSE